MKHVTVIVLLSIALCGPVAGQTPSRMLSIDDFLSLDRISDPRPSPDGAWISYSQSVTDLDANTRSTDLWIAPSDGGEARLVSDVQVRFARQPRSRMS